MSTLDAQSDNDDVHLQTTVAVLKATVERHEGQWEGVYSRLGKIERLCYIGVGGITVIAGMIGIFGTQLVKMDVSDRYKRTEANEDKREANYRDEEIRRRVERLERK